jgi:fatty acid desaturase
MLTDLELKVSDQRATKRRTEYPEDRHDEVSILVIYLPLRIFSGFLRSSQASFGRVRLPFCVLPLPC